MRYILPAVLVVLLLVLSCSEENSGRDSVQGSAMPSVGVDPDTSFMLPEDAGNRDRENWQKPQMVVSRLGDLSDKTVADIGAGTGYFTLRLARKAKKVIAVDIEERFLDYINRRLKRMRDGEDLHIETRMTVADDPSLNPGEADLVLVVNTYAYIGNRVAYFTKVHEGLAPNGRLVIVDFKKMNLPVGPPLEEKVSASLVQSELDSAGFHVTNIDVTSLDYQYTVTAEKHH